MSYLNFLCRTSVLRNLLSDELVKILNLLATHNILAIPFKGSVLSILVYQNLTLRQFGDLDILIDRQDVEAAQSLLAQRGYRLASLTEEQTQDLDYNREELPLIHPEKNIAVDLHWKISPSFFRFDISLAEWNSRLQSVSLCGETVLTFSLEDMLLHLCAHAATHQWMRLEWLCDIAEFIQARRAEIDWEQLIQQSIAVGCERILLLSGLMASELLGLQLPVLLAQKIRADGTLRSLAGLDLSPLMLGQFDEASRWSKMRPRERIASLLAFVRMREQPTDQIRHFLHLLRPTPSDYSIVHLPRKLRYLYWLVRPARVAQKYGVSLIRELII